MAEKNIFHSLKDKKVLITGSSGGIGACMTELFADYGAYVGMHYNCGKENASKLFNEIRGKKGRVELFQGNLLNHSVRTGLISLFVKKFGGIDILINNAGACQDYISFAQLSDESWNKTFDLNAKAPFYLSSKAFQYMKKKGGGKIINISSVNVKYGGSSKNMHYAASKAALECITKGFAREGAQFNILVNSIRCGLINTSMKSKVTGYSDELFKKRIQLIPLKRPGTPIDIAFMALFLASEAGNFITGEIYTVAGGD